MKWFKESIVITADDAENVLRALGYVSEQDIENLRRKEKARERIAKMKASLCSECGHKQCQCQ